MGFLKRLFGGGDDEEQYRPASRPARRGYRDDERLSEDQRAIERYRYMLRTAPPETLEESHAEAFAQLTPEQRQMVLQELSAGLPEQERMAAARAGDDPRALARTATRAEMRQPGTLERTFSGLDNRPGFGGVGMGGLMAGGFFSSFAGVMVGSLIAQSFFDNDSGSDGGDYGESAGSDDQAADAGFDGGDYGVGDVGAGDLGGDIGAGDFGDFSGGDFGGDF
jgi:hypothetical protein